VGGGSRRGRAAEDQRVHEQERRDGRHQDRERPPERALRKPPVALSEAATAAAVLSFSLGMQAGITAVNALLGVLAGMVAFRTLRPFAAIRAGIRLAQA
jgi:hypothetical protein